MLIIPVPSLEELPPLTFDSVCMSLDSGAVHNWRSLVNHLKDYTYQDIMQLSIVERRVSTSQSSSLIHAPPPQKYYTHVPSALREIVHLSLSYMT